jgi:hypothetical protein
MADNESIHDDIREIRTALTTLVAQGARTEQMYVGLNERLYGGSGAIPVLFKAVSDQKALCVACQTDIKAVAAKVKEQKAWAIGLSTGVAFAIQGAKLGIVKLFHL